MLVKGLRGTTLEDLHELRPDPVVVEDGLSDVFDERNERDQVWGLD